MVMDTNSQGMDPVETPPRLAANRVRLVFLVLLTVVSLCFVYLMIQPFLKPIVTATRMAIAASAVHRWIHRRLRNSLLVPAEDLVVRDGSDPKTKKTEKSSSNPGVGF